MPKGHCENCGELRPLHPVEDGGYTYMVCVECESMMWDEDDEDDDTHAYGDS